MRGASVLVFLGLCGHWAIAQFLNNKPFPTYSLENMPDTGFSCRDKILGGYYADQETMCQMFHVCVKVAGVGVQDFRFLCPNGTAFDQDHQICADWEDVDCDASTLYYSSDNFDLYRIGSGFESKAQKYGEDEETFALQRAETGDHRLNREHQSNRINQQKQTTYSGKPRIPVNRNNQNNNNNNNNNNEKDIFKGSSSSNFFNNRNNGKERDEDYDENVNVNQDRDFEQRRKVVRNKVRRPVHRQNQNVESNSNRGSNNNQNAENNNRRNNNNNQNTDYNTRGSNNNQNAEYNNRDNNNQNADSNTRGSNNNNQNAEYNRSNKNTQNSDSNRNTNNNQNGDNRSNSNNQNAEYNRRNQNDQTTKAAPKVEFDPTKRPSFVNNFAGSSYIPTTLKPSSTTNEQVTTFAPISYRTRPAPRTRDYESQSPTYTISTPAPFKQTQQYNPPPVRATTSTENYPQQKLRTTQEPAKPKQTTFTQNYESTKVKYEKTENYPSNNPQYFEKKPTTPIRQHHQQPSTNGVTTQAAPRSFATFPTIPTTFAPKTSAAYAQLAQQTAKLQAAQKVSTKAAPFTQYTPTVPKVASTTPIARSSRYDETQYDDGSYNPKYDYDADRREDEFLKTAHSQNIAASRNEFAIKATTKQLQQQQTQRTTSYDSPRPFSATTTTPTVQPTKTTSKNNQASLKANLNPKKTKDASYDYAYYDTSVGSEHDYDINTEIKKSTVKN